jgi:predicted metal-dependent enzyme (double-stranded beta helix superfamily)
MSTNTLAAFAAAAIVEPIRRAVENDRVTELARVLADLEGAGVFERPGLFADPHPDRYARRLIWGEPQHRFVVIGMTWAPGQSAPLHDHGGLCGAEAVVRGTMRQTSFRLIDRDASERYRFVREGEELCGKGTVSVVIPPLEYHELANASDTVAHTVHVYRGALERCLTFTHDADGWWRTQTVELSYDA